MLRGQGMCQQGVYAGVGALVDKNNSELQTCLEGCNKDCDECQ